MTAATRLTAPVAGLGEGPYWHRPTSELIMVDLLRGDLLRIDAGGSTRRTHVSDIVSVLRPRTGGGFVAGIERAFQYLDADLVPVGDPVPAFDRPEIRFNDGGCDPQGRFYVGTMAYAGTPGAGRLYRLDPSGSVSVVLEGVTISNGIQWSADGSRVYYNDTPTGKITVFDFDATNGTLHDPRDFATITAGGNPDGMAIDVEDGIWVALWGGGAVHRYDSSGALTEVIELPVSKVTCPTFGGPDLRTLYVTTAGNDSGPGHEPDAGAVFVAETGVTGAVPYAFAG